MRPQDFVHLHCHSTYSLLEALPSPEEIVERAQELGQTAVGLADKGYTHGLIEFTKACQSRGLKPILGMETYMAARTRFDKDSAQDTRRYPLTLLAMTNEGYRNLLALATKAALEGMYYKPRIDLELLREYGRGLIALSGPISGAIPQAALAEDVERLAMLTEQYQACVGKENLYYELMDLPNVPGQAEINQQLIRCGQELGVPMVATCNSHYCRRDDAEAHDVLLCIQKNANVADTGRFSMRDSDLSMRTYEELDRAFAHVPSALENTRIIADRCDVTIEFGRSRLPTFPVPAGKSEATLLSEQCEAGLQAKYVRDLVDEDKTKILRERLSYELSVIRDMGFSGYFLIVADFVREARHRGITVGPGRGSAAGSLVSYVLGITSLDPIAQGLLFERFLNPERISMPDIDIDFADTRRDEVLAYVREKYGSDRVIQICTFGTLAARAAVKDVGRAFGMSFAEMNVLAKLISDRPGTTLSEALETDELRQAVSANPTYRRIVDVALKLEGKARHVSVHACGVVITPEPAVLSTALQRAPKNEDIIITQYDAKPLEALGLLKMDFLGLKNLTIIETALRIIERTHHTTIDITTIPIDDAPTFALLSRGETTGVFQLESAGMRRYLKQLKPTTLDDITAMVSLFRPGPMDKIPDYIKCKNGAQAVTYLHPDLEPILRPTYGVGIYQEQILEMAKVFAGFSLGEADLLRRAIGKKIKKELDAQRDKFIRGSVAKGYSERLATTLFDDVITPFANYGFNKSHGACYARIAYETAYLKAHYPTEFMAALLSSESGDTDRISVEIDEARAMGIRVLPPDINESLAHFTALPEHTIRFGLLGIKGVGANSIAQILSIRDQEGRFRSIEDFARRVPGKTLNKKLLESLAKAGALDSLGERGRFVAQYDRIVDYSKSVGAAGAAQGDLFAGLEASSGAVRIEFDPAEPATTFQKLAWERETLGLYVSSHPLAGLRKYIGKKARLIESLTDDDVKKKVTVAGIPESVKVMHTKKGESMAIVTIEDPTGRIEVMLFPKAYAQYRDLLEQADSLLVMGGTLDKRMGGMQLKVDAMKRASLPTMVERAKADGLYNEEEARTWNGAARRPETEEEAPSVDVVDEGGTPDDAQARVASDAIATEMETSATHAVPMAPVVQGPIATWIVDGMPIDAAVEATGISASSAKHPELPGALRLESDGALSVLTLTLPPQAPRQLLTEIKEIFQTFPGSETVRLRIGDRLVPIGITIAMSPIVDKKIMDVLRRYDIA